MTSAMLDEAGPVAERARKGPKPIVWIALKVGISAAILFALFWKFRGELPSVLSIKPGPAIAAIALLLIQPVLIGCRWRLLLRRYDSRLSLRTLTSITWVSVFANQFLPAGVGGDAIRVVYACRLGAKLGAATASIVADRAMALAALAALILLLGPQLPQAIDHHILLALAAACIAGGISLAALLVLARRFPRLVRLPIVGRVVEVALYVLKAVEHPQILLATVALSIVVHLLSLAAFLAIARGLSIATPIMPFLAVAALLAFIQIVPVSIGGWGVREIAAVSLLHPLGVAAGPALLASVLFGVCYAAASLPGAVIWPFMIERKDGRAGKPARQTS